MNCPSGKIPFKSHQDALNQAIAMGHHVYQCRYCNQYHTTTTHTKKAFRKQKETKRKQRLSRANGKPSWRRSKMKFQGAF